MALVLELVRSISTMHIRGSREMSPEKCLGAALSRASWRGSHSLPPSPCSTIMSLSFELMLTKADSIAMAQGKDQFEGWQTYPRDIRYQSHVGTADRAIVFERLQNDAARLFSSDKPALDVVGVPRALSKGILFLSSHYKTDPRFVCRN